jgi:hypothetical protein
VPEASWLLVFRSPWGSALSLYRRLDETTTSEPLLAIHAWIHANRLLLDFSRRHPGRCLVRELEQVKAEPARTFAAIRDHLGVPLGKPPACFDPTLLGGDRAAIEEQAELVRPLLPAADALYHDLRREAGSEVPLPATRRPSQADPRRAATLAGVTAWARVSRTQIHAHAAHVTAVEAVAARDAAAAAGAAAAEARETLARDSTAVRAVAEAEIEALLGELHRVHVRLDEATGVAALKPRKRTVDTLRREASWLAWQARRIVREQVLGGKP